MDCLDFHEKTIFFIAHGFLFN